MVYRGAEIAFEKGERIDGGGNGDVFYAVSETELDSKRVAKFLRVNNDKRFETKYKRFRNEINVVRKLNNEIDGLLPIIDFYTPQKLNKGECP